MEEQRFNLKASFTFSDNVEKASQILKEFFVRANKEILLKGVPKGKEEEAAKIKAWELKGNQLEVNIESGRYVRAHVAVLRIGKILAETLGKNYKVGLRSINVKDFFINLSTTQALPKEIVERVKSLPKIQDVKAEANILNLLLKPLTESELKRNIPDRIISLAEKIIEDGLKKPTIIPKMPILKKSPPKPIKFSEDPLKVALQLGWIKEFPGRGQYIYTAPYAKLFEIIKETLLKEIARKLGFQPFLLPKLIPLEVMKRMPGYLDEIPEGMYYVCPPPRDPGAFTRFKDQFKITKDIPKKELKKVIKDPEYVLAPAQCEPFWQFYSHEIVRVEELPFKLYDSSGWTYRWEGGGVEGLVRLQEFMRIELTYLGTPEQVVDIRDSIMNECVRVADKILGLEWKITAATPFYMKGGEIAVDITDSKNVAAYDIEIFLPYRGPRESAEWLEIAGCFVHKTKFVDSFKIREIKGRDIWTGCTGLGISRWVAAFLAEHGFNSKDWPKEIREQAEPLPEVPKTLEWPAVKKKE
ncbi:MAG: serine--tRNA ligase [Euryarchaeota archaeon]|nr:serine--tRNA ligase [Euryarchaeota archaeon]